MIHLALTASYKTLRLMTRRFGSDVYQICQPPRYSSEQRAVVVGVGVQISRDERDEACKPSIRSHLLLGRWNSIRCRVRE